jgi:hypothetical protein
VVAGGCRWLQVVAGGCRWLQVVGAGLLPRAKHDGPIRGETQTPSTIYFSNVAKETVPGGVSDGGWHHALLIVPVIRSLVLFLLASIVALEKRGLVHGLSVHGGTSDNHAKS